MRWSLAQSDHTLVDVIVVDDLDRKPIGRPWLTLMIDVAGRAAAWMLFELIKAS